MEILKDRWFWEKLFCNVCIKVGTVEVEGGYATPIFWFYNLPYLWMICTWTNLYNKTCLGNYMVKPCETTTFIETKQKEVPSLKLAVYTWKMDGWNTGCVLGPCFLANAILVFRECSDSSPLFLRIGQARLGAKSLLWFAQSPGGSTKKSITNWATQKHAQEKNKVMSA